MGFFSAIKKMFGGAEQADATAPQDDAAAKAAAESGVESGAEVGAEAGAESIAEAAAPDTAQVAQPHVDSPEDEALTLR